MPTWPGTLPTLFQLTGFKETEVDNLIRTQTDKGPPKVRRRGSDAPRKISGNMILNGTQYSTFRSYYRTDLRDGSLTIENLDDAHGVSRTFRISKSPEYEPMGNDFWRVSLELEELF